jgi:hypothetical protein
MNWATRPTAQYRLHLVRLQEYCERQGVYSMRELNVDLLETFKVEGLPDLADTSKSTVVAKLRCFLRDAFRRGWINDPLVERVRATALCTIRRNRTPTKRLRRS